MAGLSWLTVGEPPLVQCWPDAPVDMFWQVRELVTPLVRALLLAGYRPYQVEVIRAGTNPNTYRYDDTTLQYRSADTASVPSVGAGVFLTVSDLFHERAMAASGVDDRSAHSHALTVAASDDAPWAGLVPGEDRRVELWSEQEWWTPQWRADLLDAVGRIVEDLVTAVAARMGEQDNPVTPRARAGLLWLFNPLFWFGTDVTFPAELGPETADPPLGPQPWPQAAGPQAAGLDPLDVPRPDDADLSEMIAVAGKAWRSLGQRPSTVLRGMIFADQYNPGTLKDVLRWLSGLFPGVRMRQFWYAVKQYGVDEATASLVASRSWCDVLVLLADTQVLAPAGYPLDAIVTGSPRDELDLAPVDPVLPVWYRDGVNQEKVVLEVAGIPAVTITATAFCTVPLINAFTWDYLAPTDGYLLTLVVVAGPGVQLTASQDRDRAWSLEVIRVWDYSSVLEHGARVQPEALLAPYPVSWAPDEPENYLGSEGMPLYGVMVYPQPHGVVLEYPMPATAEDQPLWRLTATAPELPGTSCIAFDVQFANPEGGTDGGMIDPYVPSIAAINVWVSSSVTVTMERLGGSASGYPFDHLQVWQLQDPAAVPLQGTTLPLPDDMRLVPPTTGPQLCEAEVALPAAGATRLEFPVDLLPPAVYEMLLFAMDVGIGMIPCVGDAVDVVELAVSLYTMRDKWGRPVTLYDQMLMLFCCMVPFVSSSAVRGAARGADDALGFALELSRGANLPLLHYIATAPSLPAAQRELMNLAQTSRSFLRFDPARQARVAAALTQLPSYRAAAERLGRTVGEDLAESYPLAIVDLLTRSRTDRRFWLPALQSSYGRWRRLHPNYPDDEAIQLWMAGTSGVERAILEALIGNPANAWMRAADLAHRSPRLSAYWPCTGPLAPLRYSGSDALSYDTYNAMSAVRDAAYTIGEHIAEKGRQVDFATPQELTRLSRLTNDLLCGLSPTGALDTALPPGTFAQYLLGERRNLAPDDIAEMLMRGFSVVDEHLANVSAGSGQLVRAEEYLRIDGCTSFFKDLLTQSGYQHSSVMEVMVAGEEYARLLARGVDNPAEWFTLQVMIGNAKGPDMVRRVGRYLQIVETKSFARIWFLLDADSHAANQVFRYVTALHTGQLALRLPNGTVLPPHPEILLRVDPTQYMQLCLTRQAPATTYTDLAARAKAMETEVNHDLRNFCIDNGITPIYRIRIEFNPLYR